MPPAGLIAGSIPSSLSSKPFFIIPAQPPASSSDSRARNVAFAKPAAPKPSQQQQRQQEPEIPVVIDTSTLVSYRAPAHKHAHHLHSIPPRDKTVKTLILDHMLWQHSRARFLQAHSELGLPITAPISHLAPVTSKGVDTADSSVGPRDASLRSAPELLLEEDIRALKYGVRGIDRIKASFEQNADERYSSAVDLDTARVQRATADGMEKVVASLLDQTITACNSSDDGRHNHGNSSTPCLYHGVRMRIALSALVNDFFARDHLVTHARDVDEDEEDMGSGSEMEEVEDNSPTPPLARRSSSASDSRMSISSLVTNQPNESPSSPASNLSRRPSESRGESLSQAEDPMSGNPHQATIATPSSSSNHPRMRLNQGQGSEHTAEQHAASIDPPLHRSLQILLPVSSYAPPNMSSHSSHVSGKPGSRQKAKPSQRSLAPPNSIFSAVPRGAGPESPWALGLGQGMGWPARVPLSSEGETSHGQAPRVWKAIGRSRELFSGGVSNTVSPSKAQGGAKPKWDVSEEESMLRGVGCVAAVGTAACPRHLRSTDDCPATCVHSTNALYALGHGQQRHPRATTIGAGLSQAGYPLRRSPHLSTSTTTTTTSKSTSSTSPSKSGVSSTESTNSGFGEVRMADVLPRFLRFSALIAKELGKEARESGEQRVVDTPYTTSSAPQQPASQFDPFSPNTSNNQDPRTTPSTTGHARPSHAWYALLCGIVTRAVLEGYIRGQWKGADPLEILFGLGMVSHDDSNMDKSSANTTEDDDSDSDYESSSFASSSGSSSSSNGDEEDDEDDLRFEPDGMPSVEEAIRILFGMGIIQQRRVQPTYFAPSPPSSSGFPNPGPSGRSGFNLAGGSTPWSPGTLTRPGVGGGDPDWEWETSERISEFATISLNSPDLITHLHELSRRYPPEPVECAALRFFEAVADWRGVPELENYKARRGPAAPTPSVPSDPIVKMEEDEPMPSLSTSGQCSEPAPAPASSTPLSPIFGYFVVPKEMNKHVPVVSTPSSPSASKKRAVDDTDSSANDRTPKSARSRATFAPDSTVEPGWTGPYGI